MEISSPIEIVAEPAPTSSLLKKLSPLTLIPLTVFVFVSTTSVTPLTSTTTDALPTSIKVTVLSPTVWDSPTCMKYSVAKLTVILVAVAAVISRSCPNKFNVIGLELVAFTKKLFVSNKSSKMY